MMSVGIWKLHSREWPRAIRRNAVPQLDVFGNLAINVHRVRDGGGSSVPFPARRIYERQRAAVPARFWRDGGFVEARTRDISLGGAFIETEAPMPIGVECLVELRLPTLTPAVQVTATVRWSSREGMGVQWGALRAQHAWAINQLFAP